MPNTTVRISSPGQLAPNSGELQRARVYKPDTTTAGEFALTEEVNGSAVGLGYFIGQASLALADALSGLPYEIEVRTVGTQDTAGFDASITIALGRGGIGWVKNGVILEHPYLDTAVSSVMGGNVNVGAVTVTSDTSGPNGATTSGNLAVKTVGGQGVGNASVVAYLTTEYVANPNTAIPRGYALSNADGSWTGMKLSAGLNYTITAEDSNGFIYGPNTVQL
jgi:hypothetical protein